MGGERRYFNESQLHHMLNRLNWMTVKELKKMCPRWYIRATWYNKALKHELKYAILLVLDQHGVSEDQFQEFFYNTTPYYWDSLSLDKDHTTQFFVRGENVSYKNAYSAKIWRRYFPIDVNSHPRGAFTSETLMDQRHHPHRQWPDNIVDPDNLLEPYIPVAQRGADPLTQTTKEPSMANTGTTNTSSTAATVQVSNANNNSGGLEAIMSELIKNALADKVETVLDDRGLTREAVIEITRDVINDASLPRTIAKKDPATGGPTLELVHKNFEAAEFWLSYGFSVYLNGPSGSGKTVAATQLATRFESELTIISCHGEMTVYDLTGFTDANGNYRETEFFRAWKDGHMILMDEVDKAPGEVNVLLNAGLAQGTITFPNGTLKKKGTTKLLFTGNTKMSGADAIYSAGQRQDASFSNRMVSIDWPFDHALEQVLAETESVTHGGTKLQGRDCHMLIIKIREKIDEMGMNYVVGQRQSMMLAAGVATGRPKDRVLDEVVYGWMDPNDATRIKTAVGA